MTRHLTAVIAVFVFTCAVPGARAGTIIYHDNFDGLSTAPLDGTSPDTDNYSTLPTVDTWRAFTDHTNNPGYEANGQLTSGLNQQAAWLPFVPTAGNVYTLSASLRNVSGAGTGWYAIGFANDMPTATDAQNATPSGLGQNRFNEGITVGRAWMLFRPTNPTSPNAPNVTHRFSGGNGTDSAVNWPDPLGHIGGGDIDMQIVIDASSALTSNWTVNFYAKLTSDTAYTDVGGGVKPLLNATIKAIGIAHSGSSSAFTGKIISYDLSAAAVPEPASSVLLAMGAIALGGLARRKS